MGFTSRNGLQYVGQVQTSFAITLDEEIGKPFLLLVNDSATDSDSIGIVEPSGKANTIPVWVAKKYAHVVLSVTTTGSTSGVEANLRGGL